MIHIKYMDNWYQTTIIQFIEHFNEYIQLCDEAILECNSETHTLDLNKLNQVLK